MSPAPRDITCNACAESKRRCGKEYPECRRCQDKDIDCVYPQPQKHRRDAHASMEPTLNSNNRGEEGHANYYNAHDIGLFDTTVDVDAGIELGDWNPDDLDVPFINEIDMSMITTDLTSFPISFSPPLPIQDATLNSRDVSNESPCIPFFLRQETWVMQHDCDFFWVRNGTNEFIHHRLYHRKMPECVQDAFTTFAAYTTRTPATKEILLQAANDRASKLIETPFQAPTDGVQAMLAQLARVHALFVYVFIRLFDGSVRFRASAEKQIPTLRRWVAQMWQTAKNHHWEHTAGSLRIDQSLRRTLLIVDISLNTYMLMAEGIAECEGYAMCTVCRGLWEAGSATKWLDISCNAKIPRLAPALTPSPLMSRYGPGDFDDFVKLCWSFVVGDEKLQYWIESSAR
ncbi:hypothetical protein F5Y16DRAFT_414183 [Xylariaceae sp. FL0255]|nr:hypothetical protein F5Y16DRAFT_414183 [Xylariaceae sp. FL0255]